ncbi:hypothetical protein Dform_01685 [Dehalogenimonas formicexedens]|uniref:Zinc-ribbon domain-containing protein n=1 Tax=Dehalogenimonas formicexedens TaxID=1839801 RepID=A0A1P8F989_9CHLR|nr:hypothetical protein Dform_01685 [Dehalogenimonas formicexedens]
MWLITGFILNLLIVGLFSEKMTKRGLDFFPSYWVIGIVLGSIILYIYIWITTKRTPIEWYEFLLGLVGSILMVLTFQNFLGSMAEMEIETASMFLLITGLPSVVLLVLTGILVDRNEYKQSQNLIRQQTTITQEPIRSYASQFCARCGEKFRSDSKYCWKCGSERKLVTVINI